MAKNYRSWMQDHKQKINDIPINQMYLPGTHDSGAYRIQSVPVWDNRYAGLVSFAMKYVPFVSRLIGRWTLTQDKDIYHQLNDGIRALDLRVSYSNTNGKLYVSHTFACVELDDVLQQIKKFMDENPGEVLFITIKPDWENRKNFEGHHQKVTSAINSMFDSILCTRDRLLDPELLKIKNLVKDNQRMIVCYPDANSDKIWDLNNVYANNWLNKTTRDDWEQELKQKNISCQRGKFNEVSTCLTPDAKYIRSNFWRDLIPLPNFSRSLVYMASTMKSYATKLVYNMFGREGCVISRDFADAEEIGADITHSVKVSFETTVFKKVNDLMSSLGPAFELISKYRSGVEEKKKFAEDFGLCQENIIQKLNELNGYVTELGMPEWPSNIIDLVNNLLTISEQVVKTKAEGIEPLKETLNIEKTYNLLISQYEASKRDMENTQVIETSHRNLHQKTH